MRIGVWRRSPGVSVYMVVRLIKSIRFMHLDWTRSSLACIVSEYLLQRECVVVDVTLLWM